MPYVILDCSTSLNGRFDSEKSDFQNNLNAYRVQKLRGSVDAIITSVERIRAKNPEFKVSDPSSGKPRIFIIDKNAETPVDAKLFKSCGKVTVVVSKSVKKSNLDRIKEACDVEVLLYGEVAVNITEILPELKKRGFAKILVEGDPILNTRFLNNNLVSELYVMLAPSMISSGETVFTEHLKTDVGLKLEGITQYGDSIVLHYLVKK